MSEGVPHRTYEIILNCSLATSFNNFVMWANRKKITPEVFNPKLVWNAQLSNRTADH